MLRLTHLSLPALLLSAALLGCESSNSNQKSGNASASAGKTAMKAGQPDAQMKAVLDKLAELNPVPIEKSTPEEARKGPTVGDAAMKLLKDKGQKMTPEPVGSVQQMKVAGGAGEIPAVVYTPKGDGPFPVIVYIHGGGWVIATPQTYDASARALTNLANAVVISIDYRRAPENKFPAAHEDAYAATQWAFANAASVKGDPARIAVAGESAGGNMAASVCLMARDRKGNMPVHQVLVYPVANYAFDTPSYQTYAMAKPLNKAMMQWFFGHYLKSPADGTNPYLSILRADVKDMPPATVITAEIDPLMSEGKAYADKLKEAGVPVKYKNYEGVTHEFFGLGAVVNKAKDAQMFAADQLKTAFAKQK